MSLWVLIPARRGSVGVKDKNIRPLHGQCLIERATHVARAIDADHIDISTDYTPDELSAYCRPFHFPRPSFLASSISGMSEVIVQWAVTRRVKDRDDVVLLQPTSLHLHRAERVLEALKQKMRPVISVDVVPTKWHTWYQLIPDAPVNVCMPKCRQDLPERVRANGLYYVMTGKAAKAGDIWHPKPVYLKTPGTVNIDTEDDWLDAEALYG